MFQVFLEHPCNGNDTNEYHFSPSNSIFRYLITYVTIEIIFKHVALNSFRTTDNFRT